ncbi:MAG: tetratricopeptide repeat protein [Elainellaceae cyanobacterium]
MFDKRKRWFVNAVLLLAVLAFIGIAALPFGSFFQQQAESTADTVSPSQQNDLEAQARGYELVLEREPNNQTALQGLLQTQIQLGDLEAAIEPLQKLAELNPDQTEYQVLLAQAQQQTGDREGAAQVYRKVLSTNPGDMNALQGLVALLIEQERPQAAIGLLQDTLQTADDTNLVQPDSVDVAAVQLLLGQVYVETGQDEAAMALYDETIASYPEDFRPLLSKALVLQAQDRNDEAQPLFTQAAELAPANYKDEINRLATSQTEPAEGPVSRPEDGPGAANSADSDEPTNEPAAEPSRETAPVDAAAPSDDAAAE